MASKKTGEGKGPPMIQATPEQIAAAQRLQDSHALLKVQFADAFIAMLFAQQERDALVVELQAARANLVTLSEELKSSTPTKTAKKG